VTIPRTELQFAKDKDTEKKILLVEVQNGMGITSTRSVPIQFQRSNSSKNGPNAKTSSLVVQINKNKLPKFREAVVRISGPQDDTKKLEDGKNEPLKFDKIKSGHYTIEIDAVISISEAKYAKGKREVDVGPDDSNDKPKVVDVDVIEVKPK